MKTSACENFKYSAHALIFEVFVRRLGQIVCLSRQNLLRANFYSLSGAFAQHYLGKDSKFWRNHVMSSACTPRNTPLLRPSLNVILRICMFPAKKEGPRQGLFSDFHWLAFACQMKRNPA